MIGVSGGSGAPIRNESGRLLLPLREDPSITFGESTRNYVDKDLRYRTTPSEQTAYRHELDKMVEEKKRMKYNERFGMTSGYGNVSELNAFSNANFPFDRHCRLSIRILGGNPDLVELRGVTQKM